MRLPVSDKVFSILGFNAGGKVSRTVAARPLILCRSERIVVRGTYYDTESVYGVGHLETIYIQIVTLGYESRFPGLLLERLQNLPR